MLQQIPERQKNGKKAQSRHHVGPRDAQSCGNTSLVCKMTWKFSSRPLCFYYKNITVSFIMYANTDFC
jgi:hypothetical protein